MVNAALIASADKCTVCEGTGGWWVVPSGGGDRYAAECKHCDGYGVEPGPRPQRTLDVEEYL